MAAPDARPPGPEELLEGSAGPVLRSLLTHAGLGLAVWDTELRCVWANDVLTRYDGIPREQRLGLPPHASLSGDAAALESTLREVLDTGACVIGRPYRVPVGQGDRRPRFLAATALRLDDPDGRPLGVALLVLDVRSGRGVQDRLAVVSEAGARIGTTLDVVRTAQELADFTVPLLADYVTVDLTEAVRLGGEPLERLGTADGRVPTFRRAGVASVHDGAPESLWASGEAVYVPEASPFMRVLHTGRPLLEPHIDTSPGTWLDHDPARAEKIRRFGMHSLLIVPLQARGLLMGVVVLVRADNPAPFDDGDRLLAEEIAARAALSLDNARRYTRERTAALTLQRSLLPRRVDGATPWRWPRTTSPPTPSTAPEGTGSTCSGCPGAARAGRRGRGGTRDRCRGCDGAVADGDPYARRPRSSSGGVADPVGPGVRASRGGGRGGRGVLLRRGDVCVRRVRPGCPYVHGRPGGASAAGRQRGRREPRLPRSAARDSARVRAAALRGCGSRAAPGWADRPLFGRAGRGPSARHRRRDGAGAEGS